MAAMIYAQSRSEMQTIISMPLDLEYNASGHQVQQSVEEGIHQLLQEGSNGLCHQLDGSVICNVRRYNYAHINLTFQSFLTATNT